VSGEPAHSNATAIRSWAYSGSRVQAFDRRCRLVLGRPFRSDRLSHTLLPKRIALPVFASDALSSVAYWRRNLPGALRRGLTAYRWRRGSAFAVAAVMLVVIASYRQNVHAYPSGAAITKSSPPTSGRRGADRGQRAAGGLRPHRGGVDGLGDVDIGSAVPFIAQHKVLFAVVAILCWPR